MASRVPPILDPSRWPGYAVQRADAWMNAQGLGDPSTDPIESYTAFPDGAPSHAEVEAMLHDDGIGARIAILPIADGMREPPTVEFSGDDGTKRNADEDDKMAAEAREQLDALGGWASARSSAIAARAHGGAVMLKGTKDGEWLSPLNIAGKELTHFTTFTPREVMVHQVQDAPGFKDYGKPLVYKLEHKITSPNGGRMMPSDVYFHASRMISFCGEDTQRARFERNQFWDDSIFSRIEYALKANAGAWQSTSGLMTKSNMVALHVKQLRELVKGNGTEKWRKRAELMRASMSVLRWILLDADQEQIENIQVSFGGLPELLDRVMMLVSAVSGIPVTKLWTRSPAGMNATGESDARNWDSFVDEYRASRLERPIKEMYATLFAAKNGPTGGRDPGRFRLKWPKLRTPSDSEEAETRAKDAQGFAALINAGVYEPEEVALSLSSKRGYTREVEIDHDIRQAMLDSDHDRLKENDFQPPDVTDPDDVTEPEPGDGGEKPPGKE